MTDKALEAAALTDLPALLSRIESGSGPDRELDTAIAIAIEGWRDSGFGSQTGEEILFDENNKVVSAPAYTIDLNACIALCERVLGPDPWFAIERQNGIKPHTEAKFWAACSPKNWSDAELKKRGLTTAPSGWATTPARALLAAIVKARMAQDDH